MAADQRGSQASAWLDQLGSNASPTEPFVVRSSGGGAFVIDHDQRRAISSGLLSAALELRLGKAQLVEPQELERWKEGPPVEVLEGPTGPPFVVVNGRKLSVRGLPVPYPVTADEMQRFPDGPVLDVAGANVPRARFENAVSGKYHVERVRTVMAREGPMKGTALLARRAANRVRRVFE